MPKNKLHKVQNPPAQAQFPQENYNWQKKSYLINSPQPSPIPIHPVLLLHCFIMQMENSIRARQRGRGERELGSALHLIYEPICRLWSPESRGGMARRESLRNVDKFHNMFSYIERTFWELPSAPKKHSPVHYSKSLQLISAPRLSTLQSML